MLYQQKILGRLWIGARVAIRLKALLHNRRQADLDLLAMSPHLQRDLGLEASFAARRSETLGLK